MTRCDFHGLNTITGKALVNLCQACTNIQSLNLANCTKLQNIYLVKIIQNIIHITSLVLSINYTSAEESNQIIDKIAEHCPQLTEFSILGKSNVSEATMINFIRTSLSYRYPLFVEVAQGSLEVI